MLLIAGSVTIVVEYIYNVKICGSTLGYTMWGMITGLLGISQWLGNEMIVSSPTWYIGVLLLCYILFFVTTWAARRIKCSPYSLYILVVLFGIIMKLICEELEYYYLPFFHQG